MSIRGLAAVALFITISSGSLAALSFSAAPTSGVLFGTAHEYVYDQSVSTNYVLSELVWGFQPIYYYGVDMALASPEGFTLRISAKSGVPGLSGTIEDSDYLYGNGVKNLFSESQNYTEQALMARLQAGYAFHVSSGFSITPLLSLDYMDMKWSAQNGYLQYPMLNANGVYPPWSSSLPKTPIYGVGIIYQQQYFIPAVGLETTLRPMEKLAIDLSVAYSPIIIARAVDNHLVRQFTTTDTFNRGTFVDPAIRFDYAVSSRMHVSLGASYRIITGLVGNSTYQNDGQTSTNPNTQYVAGPQSGASSTNAAGAAFNALNVSLSVGLSL